MLTEVAKNLCEQYGPHRLEFDGTTVDNQQSLIIIEAAPFKVHKNSYEGLRPFGDQIIRPLSLITSSDDIHALSPDDLAIVYLPPQMFQGNNLRHALTDLALTAKARNFPLAVLAAGSIATQHAIRNIIDNGHAVWFTDNEEFKPAEGIRLFKTTDGDYDWEREDPIALQGRIQGRGVERIGGKAIGLEKLAAHGFKTPPRFVLETSLFRRIIEDLGLNEKLAKLDQLSATDTLEEIAIFTEDIRERIVNLSDNHIPYLEEALAQIGGDLFAVRSSARLEDGRFSLAGIYHTELNARREGLRNAILKVMASAVDPLAVKAALGMDVKPSEASIAVIIQKMVKGPAAGTIFTKEHLKGDEDVLRIEAVRGLGNQIVDGTAEKKDVQIILVHKKTGRITNNDISGSGPILDDDQIEELIKQGLAIETALGEGPQDIEWAISDEDSEKGEIVFLQTRPL